ncbi:hypothetical protein pb186bvf_019097 [Paramecium bursaria]
MKIGDRALAVWLGDGFYHFTTQDGGNLNFNQNINHPADIEAYEQKKLVAFIKFGRDLVQRKDFPATHIAPNLLRYYLGRNDGVYPSYNVQVSEGIFIELKRVQMIGQRLSRNLMILMYIQEQEDHTKD